MMLRPGRRHEARGHAGDEPGEDQHPARVGKAAEPGEEHEHGERDQEDPAPAEQVGGAAAEQHEAGVPEHVGADHPVRGAGGQVEVRADRRHGDVEHRDVDALEEEGAAQDEEQGPLARRHPLEGGWRGLDGHGHGHSSTVIDRR